MKGLKLFCFLLVLLFLKGCGRCIMPEDGYVHNLLIYMAADNSLSDLALENMNEIIAHADVPEDHALLVFIDRRNTGAFLIRPRKVNSQVILDTIQRYGTVNSGEVSMLTSVIATTRQECPAQSYGLILWSHGTGWLPKGLYGESATPAIALQSFSPSGTFRYNIHDSVYPGVKTFGQDGESQMEIADLSYALKTYHHDYICFDACLMADVQTYYELKDVCDYIVGSPAEIIDTGFPYDKLLSVIMPYKGRENLIALCDAYYNKYNAMAGYNKSATISLVSTQFLIPLAMAFGELVAHTSVDPETVDRESLQTYDRLREHVFFDIERMARELGDDTRYNAFCEVLNNVVVYKKSTEYFITIPINHFSGLAAYLPTERLPRIQSGFRNTSWNRIIGGWVSE